MRWLILIGDDSFSINTLKSIKYNGCVECYDVTGVEGRYCIDFGEDHIFYDYNQNTLEFSDVLTEIPFIKPNFITMIYTSKERVKKVLQQKDFPNNIYIDNDYGLVLPIKEFIRLGMPLDNG